jgi:hypothetical protein
MLLESFDKLLAPIIITLVLQACLNNIIVNTAIASVMQPSTTDHSNAKLIQETY